MVNNGHESYVSLAGTIDMYIPTNCTCTCVLHVHACSEKLYCILNCTPLTSVLLYLSLTVLKRFAGYQYRHKLETDVDIPQTLDVSAFASDDMNG